MIYSFRGIARTSPTFRDELEALGARLDIDPNAMAAVMSIESGFNPAARNPSGGAIGLIQFMPSTLRPWGLTTQEVAVMTDIQQLALVERFYQHSRGIHDAGTLYMMTFLPKYALYADSFVLGRKNDFTVRDGLQLHKIWAQNSGLDVDVDGEITVGEVKSLARKRYESAKSATSGPITEPAPPLPEPALAPPLPLDVDWDEHRAARDAAIRDKDDE